MCDETMLCVNEIDVHLIKHQLSVDRVILFLILMVLILSILRLLVFK